MEAREIALCIAGRGLGHVPCTVRLRIRTRRRLGVAWPKHGSGVYIDR